MKCAFIFLLHAAAVKFTAQAVVDFNRTVDYFNDLTERDMVCCAGELVAAADTLKGLCQTGLRQPAQDFQGEPRRNPAVILNLLCTDRLISLSQTVHNTDCVIRLMRDSHAAPPEGLLSFDIYSIADSCGMSSSNSYYF